MSTLKKSLKKTSKSSLIFLALSGLLISVGFGQRLYFAFCDDCYWLGTNSYINIAENMVDGRGFVDTLSNFGVPDRTRRPPLIPGILAAFMKMTDKGAGIALFFLFQGLIGALTALLVAIWGLRISYSKGVYWFLLLIYSFWAPAMGLMPCVMTETTFIFLFTGASIFLMEGFRFPKWPFFAAAGILIGLASLARPILYPLYFLLAFGWPWLFFKPARVTGKRKAYFAMVFFISLLVVIFPWIQRNMNINDRFTLITSNVGLNLLMQNTDKSRPEVWIDLMEKSRKGGDLSNIDEATRDRLLLRKAFKAIREKPLAMAGRFIDRAIHIYNNSNDNSPDLKYNLQWSNFWTFFLLAGLIILIGSRFSDGLLLLIIQLNFIIIYGLIFFEARFRETVIPCHLVLASLGGLYLIRGINEFRKK